MGVRRARQSFEVHMWGMFRDTHLRVERVCGEADGGGGMASVVGQGFYERAGPPDPFP